MWSVINAEVIIFQLEDPSTRRALCDNGMGWNAIDRRENSRPNGERWGDPPRFGRRIKAKIYHAKMDEGRKRVIGIMAAILASLHMRTADDLFGGAGAAHGRTN